MMTDFDGNARTVLEMGMLGNKRLIPNAPFRNVQMDLSGPHLVKEFVNKRAATRKICALELIIKNHKYEKTSINHFPFQTKIKIIIFSR